MEITLRKASSVQQELQTQLNILQNRVDARVELTEFKDPEEVLEDRRADVLSVIDECEGVANAIYEIRDAVGKENAASGVSEILAKIAQANRIISVYRNFTSLEPREDIVIIKGKLDKISKSDDSYPSYSNKVVSNSLYESDIIALEERVKELKKIKSQLSDRLLEINVSAKIKLSNSTAEVVRKAGLA